LHDDAIDRARLMGQYYDKVPNGDGAERHITDGSVALLMRVRWHSASEGLEGRRSVADGVRFQRLPA